MRALVAINVAMRRLCKPCARSSDETSELVWLNWVDQSNSYALYQSDPVGSERLRAAFDLYDDDPRAGFTQILDLAKDGSPWAMLHVGYDYEAGVGVDADDAQAEAWYRKSWENGSEEAALRLGHFYERLGRPDDAEAVYRSCAVAGWAPAMTNLAKLMLRKRRSRANAREATVWLERAAEGGDVVAPVCLAFTKMIGRHGSLGIVPGFRSMCVEAERLDTELDRFRQSAG